MAGMSFRYSEEEFERRGEEIFARDIEPRTKEEAPHKSVLIDIESGDYEIDADEIAASDRLLARHPDAQVWMRRVGSPYAHRLGGRLRFGGQ
jgi:hypothetical protein